MRYDQWEYPTPRAWFESVTTYIVGPASTAVPRSFFCQARAAALCGGVPVDIHISKGNIHRFPKAIIRAGVESCLFNHHEMHMMPGAGAGVIHLRDFHALPNIRASDLYTRRYAILGDVQVIW